MHAVIGGADVAARVFETRPRRRRTCCARQWPPLRFRLYYYIFLCGRLTGGGRPAVCGRVGARGQPRRGGRAAERRARRAGAAHCQSAARPGAWLGSPHCHHLAHPCYRHQCRWCWQRSAAVPETLLPRLSPVLAPASTLTLLAVTSRSLCCRRGSTACCAGARFWQRPECRRACMRGRAASPVMHALQPQCARQQLL